MTINSLDDKTDETTPAYTGIDADAISMTVDYRDDAGDSNAASGESEFSPTTLIVSESEQAAGYIESCLAEAGIDKVQYVQEGPDAIDVARQVKPVLVLMDSNLPGQIITMAAIKSSGDLKAVAVVEFEVVLDQAASPVVRLVDSTSLSKDWDRHLSRIRDTIGCKTALLSQVVDRGYDSRHLEREPRYLIPKGMELGGSIELNVDGERSNIAGQLRDLSSSGAKLDLSVAVDPGATLVVRLQEPDANIDTSITAEVRWCQPCSKHEFRVGCRFESKLSADILQELAALGYLERRSNGRRHVMITTVVKQELAGTSLESGTIVDYSHEGLRLCLPSQKEIGQRLLVHCSRGGHDESAVPVRTLWHTSVNDGFEVGCCFLNKQGYELIQRIDLSDGVAKSNSSKNAAKSSINLSGIWWIGLFTIMALCFIATIEVVEDLILWWMAK